MHTKARSVTFFFVVCVVFVGLFAGCSGGGTGQEDQQGSQKSGGNGGQGGEATQDGAAQGAKGASRPKMALGTVKRVNYENRKLVVRPSQGEGLVTFKLAKEATITLDDKEAELADAKEGQSAQIEYIVKNEKNRARSVQLFSADDSGG